MFLNPEQPITTCSSPSCDNCGAKDVIHCHFTLKDYVHFLLLSLPAFLIAGVSSYQASGSHLAIWLAIVVAYFGLIEIRVMCSHCPHYAESGATLRCWANYGAPKLWKYRPGPMNKIENLLFFSGGAAVWGYPLILLVFNRQLFMLILFLMTTAGFFMTLKSFLCSRCMNFACPLNSVSEKNRQLFFDRNPVVARAWGQKTNAGESKL